MSPHKKCLALLDAAANGVLCIFKMTPFGLLFTPCRTLFKKAASRLIPGKCKQKGSLLFKYTQNKTRRRLTFVALTFTMLFFVHQWISYHNTRRFSQWELESFQIIRSLRSVRPDLSDSIGTALSKTVVVVQNNSRLIEHIAAEPDIPRMKGPVKSSQPMDEFLAENMDWSHEARACHTPPCNTSDWCPAVPFKWKSCDLTFFTEVIPGVTKQSLSNTTHPFHLLHVSIKGRKMARWSAHGGIYLAVLNDACDVQIVKEFTILKQAGAFVDKLPSRTLVVGLVTGINGKLLTWKFQFKMKLRFRNYFFPFVVRKSFPGLGNYDVQHLSALRNHTWTRPILTGVNFPVNKTDFPFEALPSLLSGVEQGHWSPSWCRPRWRIAIILPFRAREQHLRIFLHNMVPFLQKQMVDFTIFVVEQTGDTAFNRAALMNTGFVEASKLGRYDCFAFHDVDLIPEDLTNLYGCTSMPRHLVAGRDNFKYLLRYPEYFGGAAMIQPRHLVAMNGFVNKFYGWGGEDDNAYMRVRAANLTITRFPQDIARYTMLDHGHDSWNPRMKRGFPFRWHHGRGINTNFSVLVKESEQGMKSLRMKKLTDVWSKEFQAEADGLHTLNYTLRSIKDLTFFIHMEVDLPGPKIGAMLCLNSTKAKLIPRDRDTLCNSSLAQDTEAGEDIYGEGPGDQDDGEGPVDVP